MQFINEFVKAKAERNIESRFQLRKRLQSGRHPSALLVGPHMMVSWNAVSHLGAMHVDWL
jgi:hypothetical protein